MSKVFFTRKINKESIVEIYKKLGINLPGNVAVKVHSGEKGNQNYLHPEMYKDIVSYVNGTIVETNTAYDGARNTTKKHLALLEEHDFNKYFKVDLLDAYGDETIPIINGKIIKENIIGEHMKNYDSLLVVSHFKGHPMGGFGGALKQLSIGCASSNGKANIHSGGKMQSQDNLWNNTCSQNDFLMSMADAASSICNMFKGRIAFISVLANISVDCDCCSVAEDPCMADIGILASIDPVAIDEAAIDLVMASNDKGKDHFMERVNSRNGLLTIKAAEELGIGSKEYDLIDID